MADTDMKPLVMEFKKVDADVVLLWVSPTHAVRIVGTAQAMQFKPQWMSTSTCSDFPLMQNISKGLWTDVVVAFFGDVPESTAPLMVKYKKAFDNLQLKTSDGACSFTPASALWNPWSKGSRGAEKISLASAS